MLKRMVKYGLVGLSGIVVGFAAITILVEVFKINPRQAWYFSTFFALLNNFLLNNFWTWSERKGKGAIIFGQKMLLYYFFAGLSVILNYFIYNFLLNHNFHYLISLGFAVIICAGLNFVINELLIWPRKVSGSQNTEGRP